MLKFSRWSVESVKPLTCIKLYSSKIELEIPTFKNNVDFIRNIKTRIIEISLIFN